MGAAAYNRGSRVIRERLDREAAERRVRVLCRGVYRNGPDKRYARCDQCGHVDYEANKGDRCNRPRA